MGILNLTALRAQVNKDIKTNGVRAITGNLMNINLIDMIDSLEDDYDTITGGIDSRVTAIESSALLILQDPSTGWDASVGTFPGGGVAKAGYYWNVSVAGTVDGVSFDLGDSLLAILDNASSSIYAANWSKKDDIDSVISVAGKVGAIILAAADITDFDAEVSNNVSVAANTAKVSNVTTNLAEGLTTNTTVEVTSSDGSNVILNPASTSRAGLMSKPKFDEVVANNAKPSEAPNDGTQYARKNLGWEAVAGSNLYTADGTLTAARTVTMAGNKLDFLGLNTGFGLSTYAGDAPAAIHVKSTNADSSIRAYNSSNQTDYTLKTNTTTGGELAILLANVRKIQIIASGNTYFNGGNVAIGTSTPNAAYKLTVASGGIIATTAGATSGTNGILLTNSLSQNLLRLRNDGQMILGTSGYLGDAPAVIQLNSKNTDSAIRAYNQNNTLNFSFKSTVAIGGEFNMYTGAGAQVIKLQGTGNNYINSGDFGVGTSSPTAKLHVVGSTLLNGNLGLFGATPIAQPTTAIIAPAAVAVGGVDVQTNDTFDGYTIAQAVRALRNLGILA